MPNIIKITEATTLAFHTMFYLFLRHDQLVPTKEIASKFGFSENHLAKILQRLVKAGFIDSIRGPKGGFKLKSDSTHISLLQIYEIIEGPLILDDCLLAKKVCKGDRCILDHLLKSLNKQFADYLADTKLTDLKNIVEVDF